MNFLLSRGKNQWEVKVSAFSGECFWSYRGRQQDARAKQSISTVPIWKIFTGAH